MTLKDTVFANKLAESRASISALMETERNLASQLENSGEQIDEAALARFGAMLRREITQSNSEFRRAYVRLLVSNITVNDNEITITGSKAALENAVRKGDPAACAAVPSFDRKWCPEEDFASHLRKRQKT
ncbi:hypothetical protein LWE61_08250 [Sphingobium sufflavum]|uniref:hypothetical protein n=1 Tax=Sphingobium sufflavum TaxID=1129547 RepID=UPI001F1E632C|nr:hypothetical protein [Sphingobium sufflavum]MCE7796553.1 hypothetical protein [Sphingobium sufflavum]